MTQQETTWRAQYSIKNRERLNAASRITYAKTKAKRAKSMALYRMRTGTRLRKITLDKLGLQQSSEEASNPSMLFFKCFSVSSSV